MEQQSFLNVTVKVYDKDLVIQLLQLFLGFKHDHEEDLEKFLSKNFSKVDFLKFAKTQITLFGLDHSGLGENTEEYEIYLETAQNLFNKFYTH